jgi:hypothetical protein
MSKYLTIDELNIDNQDLLVQTLQHDVLFQGRLGLPGLEIESHDLAVHLFGIQDKQRPETAEVIIRRQFVGGAANDIGFKRAESGNFVPIISEYDNGYGQYGEAWRDQLSQRYGERKYAQDMYENGFQLDSKELQQDGTTAMTFSRMGGI